MFSCWRIIKKKHANNAFDGEGAKRFGGRWNYRGESVVYTSETLSLAALETFVHIERTDVSFDLVSIEVKVPKSIPIETMDSESLKEILANQTMQDVGSKWLRQNKTVLFKVSSILIPSEYNLLINPLHKNFSKLKIQPGKTFTFDKRMLTQK